MSITSNLISLKNKLPTENEYFKLISILSICIFIIIIALIIIRRYRFKKINPVFWRKSKNAMENKKIPRKLIYESDSGYTFTWSFWYYLDDWDYKFKKWKHIFTRGIFSSENEINNQENHCISETLREKKIAELNEELIDHMTKLDNKNLTKEQKERHDIKRRSLQETINDFRSGPEFNCKDNHTCKFTTVTWHVGSMDIEKKSDYGTCVHNSQLQLEKKCNPNAPNGTQYACEDGLNCKNVDKTSGYGKCQLIENNISENYPIRTNDTVSPAVFFHPNTNNIVIFISTEKDVEKIIIEDIPLQEWCQITIVLNKLNVDVYNNAKLSKTFLLSSPPKTIDGDIFVNQDGGFSGELSSLSYSPNTISPKELKKKYNNGPSQISLIQRLLIKMGLIRSPVQPMSKEFQNKASEIKPNVLDKIEDKIKDKIKHIFDKSKDKDKEEKCTRGL